MRTAPENLSIRLRRNRAVRRAETGTRAQAVTLDGRSSLLSDRVVLAHGHTDMPVSAGTARSGPRAYGFGSLPPGNPAESGPAFSGPGGREALRGLGLGFSDLPAPLTVGRGGMFHREGGEGGEGGAPGVVEMAGPGPHIAAAPDGSAVGRVKSPAPGGGCPRSSGPGCPAPASGAPPARSCGTCASAGPAPLPHPRRHRRARGDRRRPGPHPASRPPGGRGAARPPPRPAPPRPAPAASLLVTRPRHTRKERCPMPVHLPVHLPVHCPTRGTETGTDSGPPNPVAALLETEDERAPGARHTERPPLRETPRLPAGAARTAAEPAAGPAVLPAPIRRGLEPAGGAVASERPNAVPAPLPDTAGTQRVLAARARRAATGGVVTFAQAPAGHPGLPGRPPAGAGQSPAPGEYLGTADELVSRVLTRPARRVESA